MGRESLSLSPAPPTTTAIAAVANPPSSLPLAVAPPSASASGSAKASTVSPTSLAPGFRFHPTDEELVIYYLKRKVSGKSFRFDAISEVDIYKSEPWDLADKSRVKTRDQEWYFFSALDKKYGNGGRMNRATSRGYWKATGNDRPVKHEERVVGLKKTLVFHSGRAPDGQRTNWVMHEYRLIDEELERVRIGSSQPQDAYVLCRVFHKNNIGPPNSHRYAPFIEEEWDDASTTVPAAEPVNGRFAAHHPHVEGNGGVLCSKETNGVVQDTQSNNKTPFDVNKLPIETQNLLAVCKRESMAEFPSPEKDDDKHMDEHPSLLPSPEKDEDPSPQTDNPKPISQIYKRRRYNYNLNSSNHSNASGDSIQPVMDPCSSITTTAATIPPTTAAASTTNTAAPKKHFLSALVEFSLMESLESKEGLTSAQLPDTLESSVPPSCVKFIKDMQSEMQKLAVEKETMRFEMMSSQAMINILQTRVEVLNRENEELRRMIQK